MGGGCLIDVCVSAKECVSHVPRVLVERATMLYLTVSSCLAYDFNSKILVKGRTFLPMAFKPHFGLDIGTSNLKVVQLAQSGKNFKLLSFGSIPTPVKSLLSESTFDVEALVEAIKKLVRDAKISIPFVATALPEAQIFTRVIEMPYLSENELSSAIKWEAEQYVPVPLTDVSLDYQVLSYPAERVAGAKMEVLLVAAPNVIIEKYVRVLTMAGLKPVAIETEIIAVARSLVGNNPYSPTTLIVNIGSATTDLSIVRAGSIAFTRSIATAGTALSRAISSDLSLEMSQAEEYKRSYGLDETKLEGKVAAALKPVFEVVLTEVKRALSSYQSKRPDDPVKRLVLCGGTAKMPGVVVYLAEALGVEVQIGDPWFNIEKDEKVKNEAARLSEEGPLFAAAVGLALRDF